MSASAHPLCKPEILELIACPACRGALRPEAERAVCAGCGRAYPVTDGIAVLIAERSEKAKADLEME